MIFQPDPFRFNAFRVFGQSAVYILLRLAADYSRGSNKQWAYYAGYGLSSAAIAGGIPGSALTFTTIALGAEALVRVFLEESPGAAEVEIFLDGATQAVVDLNAVEGVLQYVLNIPNDGEQHTIALANLGTSAAVAGATDWLSLLQVETENADLVEIGATAVSTFIISATIQDAKASGSARVRNTQVASIHVPIGSLTLGDIEAYHDAYIQALDDVTEGVITGSNVTLNFDLPAGIKSSAVADSDVQEGVLMTFSMNGTTYKESLRVPAVVAAKLTGTALNTGDTDVSAFADLLTGTTQTNGKTIAASNRFGNAFTALLGGSKSFRK